MTVGRARLAAIAVIAAVAATTGGSAAMAGGDSRGGANTLHEQLTGYEETPLAVSTAGKGSFRATINERAQEITWTLSYRDLGSTMTQAHIHFGTRAQTGGISVFFCTNLGNGPAGTPACPPAPATISGVFRPGDIIGPGAQGLGPGEFDELVAAIRSGTTYVNVHSTGFPIGEIRGQIEPHHHH